jgi:hypothetical protein
LSDILLNYRVITDRPLRHVHKIHLFMIHEHKVFVNSRDIELDLIVALATRQFKPATYQLPSHHHWKNYPPAGIFYIGILSSTFVFLRLHTIHNSTRLIGTILTGCRLLNRSFLMKPISPKLVANCIHYHFKQFGGFICSSERAILSSHSFVLRQV